MAVDGKLSGTTDVALAPLFMLGHCPLGKAVICGTMKSHRGGGFHNPAGSLTAEGGGEWGSNKAAGLVQVLHRDHTEAWSTSRFDIWATPQRN